VHPAAAVRADAIRSRDADRRRMDEVHRLATAVDRRRVMAVDRRRLMVADRRNDVPIEVNPRNDAATTTD
jgi:hypothetical protein